MTQQVRLPFPAEKEASNIEGCHQCATCMGAAAELACIHWTLGQCDESCNEPDRHICPQLASVKQHG